MCDQCYLVYCSNLTTHKQSYNDHWVIKCTSNNCWLLPTVAQSNALLQIKKAEYYQDAETKERQAHAAVQEAEYLAQAKANLALAEKVGPV